MQDTKSRTSLPGDLALAVKDRASSSSNAVYHAAPQQLLTPSSSSNLRDALSSIVQHFFEGVSSTDTTALFEAMVHTWTRAVRLQLVERSDGAKLEFWEMVASVSHELTHLHLDLECLRLR